MYPGKQHRTRLTSPAALTEMAMSMSSSQRIVPACRMTHRSEPSHKRISNVVAREHVVNRSPHLDYTQFLLNCHLRQKY